MAPDGESLQWWTLDGLRSLAVHRLVSPGEVFIFPLAVTRVCPPFLQGGDSAAVESAYLLRPPEGYAVQWVLLPSWSTPVA